MRRLHAADDSGISLVELLVYMFLSVIVLTIVGTILINSLSAESIVRSSAESASTSQVATLSLNRGIHNASAIEVSTPAADIELLRSRSIDSSDDGVWRCEAWAVVDGELRWTTSSTAISPPLTASQVSTWTLLVDGVSKIGTDSYFASSAGGRGVDISFTAAGGNGIPISLSTQIVSRQPVPATGIESLPCF